MNWPAVLALLLRLGTDPTTDPGAVQVGDDAACLLKVKVVDVRTAPRNGVLVELLDAGGRVVLSKRTDSGEASVCDFGFGTYSLRVAGNARFPTIVGGIRSVPSRPLRFVVVVNELERQADHRTSCEAYLRLTTTGGTPISSAEAWVPRSGWKVIGDRFGRLLFPVSRSGTTSVTVGATGYTPRDVQLECRDIEDIEQTVVLEQK